MKKFSIIVLVLLITFAGAVGIIWYNTQPVWIVEVKVDENVLNNLPFKNRRIIQLMEARGEELAPTYPSAVCTEFVIKVISSVDSLTASEKNDIRIITQAALDSLIEADSPIIKGVQTALVKGGKGKAIKVDEVVPGDLVQFWNVFQGQGYGHCGVVLDVKPNETITLYSSHPITGGYGKQTYLWPEKVYFARLK